MAAATQVPETMKGLILKSTEILPAVEVIPTPKVADGTAVVRILVAATLKIMKLVYTGRLKLPVPKPMIPGTSAIARVVATGSDATKVREGDLVFFNCVIESRDNPADVYLSAVPVTLTEGAKVLKDCFGYGAFAEYCRTPLENLTILDETRLTGGAAAGGLGYTIEQLALPSLLLVPFGGMTDIGLKAGETIIIAPATGTFSGSAVHCALALGARVLALGRDASTLAELKQRVSNPERFEAVTITGDVDADLAKLKTFGEIDAFLDIGPQQALTSPHIKLGILALRNGGRVSFMAGYREDVAIPYSSIVAKNIRLHGRYMYNRADVQQMFNMIERGVLDLRVGDMQGEYSLEQWREAWDQAADTAGPAALTVIKP